MAASPGGRLGRLLQDLVGRRRRRLRIESRRRLRRHGRSNVIQGDGVYKTTDGGKTWTHVGLEKTMAIGRIRVHPDQSRHRLRRRARRSLRAQPRTRRLQDDRRRQDLDAVLFRDDKTGAVDLSMDPKNPDVLYAGLWEVFRTPHSLSSGGPGSGLFKTTDGGKTWTELTKNPGLPKPIWGKIGVSGLGRRSEPRLRDHRSRRRRRLSLRRRRRHLEAGQRRPPAAPARLLLHAHLRRPAGEGHGLHPQHRPLSFDRRRQDDPRSACRTATTTISGSRRTIRADDQQQRRRRQRLDQRRRDCGPIRTIRPRSSTTSSPRRTCRITSAARSRTTPRRACRAPAASSTPSAAARAATSRPIRKTPTSSTPAATAAC